MNIYITLIEHKDGATNTKDVAMVVDGGVTTVVKTHQKPLIHMAALFYLLIVPPPVLLRSRAYP